MKGHWIPFSKEELAFIEAGKEWPRRELLQAFCERFGRSDLSLANLNGLCKRKGWMTGRTGQFAKGLVPHNTGRKMPYNANSARTRFKKGNLPHNTKFAGHERMTRDGYVEVSVDEINPHTGFERRYVHKHRWLWEKQHGPVPEGMRLKCLDGNRANTDPANWEAVPFALAPRLNGRFGRGYDTAPPELKPTIMAIAKLEHAARTKAGSK